MLLRNIYYYFVDPNNGFTGQVSPLALILALVDFTAAAPVLATTFSKLEDWTVLPSNIKTTLVESAPKLLLALISAANEAQELVVESFRSILKQMPYMSLAAFAELIETICLTVRSPEVALDLLLGSLEPESARLLVGRPAVVQHFVRSLMGVTLDHIDEAIGATSSRLGPLLLTLSGEEQIVCCRLRIDAHVSRPLTILDHVRLTTSSSPSNSLTQKLFSMDALVKASEPGRVTLQCLHPVPRFVEECSWDLVNCGSFVTTQTMFKAISSFALDPENCCSIQEQLLGLPTPDVATSTASETAYLLCENLNESQNAAVAASLDASLICLWGPPGTGKTHTIVAILQELFLHHEPHQRILVAAPTHNAVDNVMRKYLAATTAKGNRIHPIRVSTDVSSY